MKVLQINAVSGIRSTGRLCAEIADYLNNNGDEGYIAYSEGIPYKNGYKIGTKSGIKLHGFFSRVFGLQAYFSRNATRKLIHYMGSIKPDAVHLENLHGNYINLKLLLNYLSKNDIPTVLTLWDCWFFTGKCCHYTTDNCYKWETVCRQCPRLKKDNKSWFFDRTTKMFNDKKAWLTGIPNLAVVGVSDWITDEAKKSFLKSAKIITRIYNWIDLDVFKPVDINDLRGKLGMESRFVILGVASVWDCAKGLDNFLELAKILSAEMSIILVGNISANVKLPDNIINIKETHNVKEMVKLYSMADVLVNLSVEETFGLVTAEALACGTPVVVINSTANPELVGNGCGYIVEIDDVEEVNRCVAEVQQNGKAFYSGLCIKYARENFLKNERIEDYLDIYRRILSC